MAQYTDAQKRAVYKYHEKLDRLYITVPKGRKEVYQQAADAAGQSLNAFCVDAIEAALPEEQEENA